MQTNMKTITYSAAFLMLFLLTTAFARDKASNTKVLNTFGNQFAKPMIGEEDGPRPVMISWIGTGALGNYTISNTGQNGYFEPPVGWTGYEGVWPSGYTSGNGRTGEFPAGSKQYYVWSAGFWVGAMVQREVGDQIIKEPRVATAAYYSDQGALSDLYQTNQRIAPGYDLDGEGDFLFKQRGVSELREYQQLWTYADTSINARRRDVGLAELQLDPARGDYMSNEDTYCVWGDYIPEEDAATMFVDGYDTDPVGIRVEQRTYSWSTDAFVYLNYRITNMNDFPIEDVYFGYFMDNDVGDATDDLIGYDENLNLGYSYDSDLQEQGWSTLAGYVGTVFLKTPKGEDGQELGLTGFQTWTIDGDESDVDNSGRDDLKYQQLSKGGFEIFGEPQDVRQLAASGPLTALQPGETVEVTIAVIAGGSLSEVKTNTEKSMERYELGYIGPEPPPPPNLTVVPGDHRAILNWDKFPESIADPFSREVDFEGYRVYRSEDGGLSWGDEAMDTDRYPSGWTPIAEYDIAGNETGRFVSTAYTSGTSAATIAFEDFASNVDDSYLEATYTIEFLPGKNLLVYNLNQFKSYQYNPNAISEGLGFAILDRDNMQAYSDPAYRSGDYITFDGILISITDGVVTDSTGAEFASPPQVGDVFKVQTFESTAIGGQAGLDYVFVDEELTNGVSYLYAVTSFDKGDPTTGLPSLESAFSNKTEIVPRATAVDRTVEQLSSVERLEGISAGLVSVEVHNPLDMIPAKFEVEFFSTDTVTQLADYLRVINTTADTVVVDSVQVVGGSASASFYGIDMVAAGPATARIDTSQFGWESGKESSFDFRIVAEKPQPFDYTIEFINALDASPYSGDEVILPAGTPAPWKVKNVTLDKTIESYSIPLITTGFGENANLRIMKENYANLNDFAFGLQLDNSDEADPIQAGDIWEIKTVKPFLASDLFTFETEGFNEVKTTDEYRLDDIKVVPNPFYVRAQWDTDRFNKHVKFTHLPAQCKIRIFTTSGILIKTIDHDENAGDPVGYQRWILRNSDNLDIASGLYIYQVKDLKSGKEKVGKFAVIL